jgi:hypothetical protein
MKNIFKFIVLFFIVLNFNYTFASSVGFYTQKFKDDNNKFLIEFNINTESESINAIEGKIEFPDSVEIKEINDGNSIINFWLEKPRIEDKKYIVFSGIIPGGFTGVDKNLIKIIARQNNSSNGEIKVNYIKAVKNSSSVQYLNVKLNNLKLPIKTNDFVKDDSTVENDSVLPELFTPAISEIGDSQNKQKVIIFATQDKGSGINHYEVKENYFDEYKSEESPYVLNDAIHYSKIYVKAIDNNKNELIVYIYPSTFVRLYHQYGIIVIIVLVILIFKRKKWLNISN